MITIDNTTYYTPYRDLLPPITEAENEMLMADIAERGIIVPVVIDPERNVIDGHNRLRIAAELGLTDILFDIRVGLSDDEKRLLAWDLNDHRRHMTKEQRQERAIEMRRNGASYRQIGGELNISYVQAKRDIDSGVTNVTPEMPERVTGKDGKKYPTRKPRKPSVLARNQEESDQAIKAMEHMVALPEITLTAADVEQAAKKQETTNGMSQPMQVLLSHESIEYYTPAEFIEAARMVMGSIDLDPASCADAQKVVKASRFYSQEIDGLSQEWQGRIWLNPPYSKTNGESNQKIWAQRLLQEYRTGKVPEAVILVKSALGYNWFEELWDTLPVCFVRQRLSFTKSDGSTDGQSKHGTALFYLGDNLEKFIEVFSKFGRITTPNGRYIYEAKNVTITNLL